jgi:hypothetical protein
MKFFSTLNTQLDTAQKILELITPFVKQDKILPRTQLCLDNAKTLDTLSANAFCMILSKS